MGEQVVVVSDDEEEGEKNVPLSPKNDNQDEPDVGDGAAPEGLEPDEEGDEEGSEYDSDDDSDDESDIAWEDVDLGAKRPFGSVFCD